MSDGNFKVSFYVPMLNAGRYIEKCILSIIQQDYPINELLIIDNCSTDNSAGIAESLKRIAGNRGIKLRVIKERHPGLANARNTAVDSAKNEFIASIDADCIIDKEWLSFLIRDFKGNNDVAGAGGRLIENNSWRAAHLKQEWGNKKLINPEFLFGANTVFRVKAIKSIGGYNEKYICNYEDVDLSKRLMAGHSKIVYEPRAVVHHLKNETLGSMLKNFWAWGFYGNEPRNIVDFAGRIAFNIKRPFELLAEDSIKGRPVFLPIDFLVFFSNPFFDLKHYFLRLKKQYF